MTSAANFVTTLGTRSRKCGFCSLEYSILLILPLLDINKMLNPTSNFDVPRDGETGDGETRT